MKNNKKMTRKTKVEKRRLAFEKRNVKKEQNRARYGAEGGSALVMAKTTEYNRRLVAALLALVFVLTSVVLGINFATKAEDDSNPSTLADEGPNSNLVLDKAISAKPDGTYALRLSAYATGQIRNTTKQIPTDYVLVVDQSGSMAYTDMPTDYEPATTPSGGWSFADFDTNTGDDKAYYFFDEESNQYYRVYRKWGDLFERIPRNTVYCREIVDRRNLTWFADEKGTESDFNSQYYYQPAADPNITRVCAGNDYIQPGGETDYNFYPLNISSRGMPLYYAIRLHYYDSAGRPHYLRFTNNPENTAANKDLETGECIWYRNPSGGRFGPGDRYALIMGYNTDLSIDINNVVINWIDGNQDWDSFYTYGQITSAIQSGMYIQNTMFIRHVGYNALAYRDSNGNEHIIDSTDYCNKNGEATRDNKGENTFRMETYNEEPLVLYQAKGRLETRLEATKNALTAFAEKVASQKDKNIDGTETPVDHRIAIVGFSSSGYNNTELLTGENLTISGTNGTQKNAAGNSDYATALIPARANDQGAVNSKITDAITALTANGGTQPEDGLDMAKEILTRNDKKDDYSTPGEDGTMKRNAVVIFFTDGRPGNYHDDNQYTEANEVVDSASGIKSNVDNVQIYSVGVFGEADGNPLTYYKSIQTWYGDVTRDYMEKARLEEDRVAAGADGWDVNSGNGYVNPSSYYDYMDYAENIYQPEFYKEDGTHSTVTVRYRHRDWVWQDYSYKYITAYVHTLSGTFWRDAVRNKAGYPEQQNDTIGDYMRVVSTEYPSATSFDGGWSTMTDSQKAATTYNAVVNGVRGTKAPTNNYFSASDSESLHNIFVNIANEATSSSIAEDTELYLKDIISSNFDIPQDPTIQVQSYLGEQNSRGGTIEFAETGTSLPSSMVSVNGKEIQINDFDFAANYIMYDKPANDDQGTKKNQGKKLVVTIHGLTPTANAGTNQPLASNDSGSGIYAVQDEADSIILDEFVSPEITRYKYELNVGSVDTNALLDIDYALQSNGTPTSSEAVVLRGANVAGRSDSLTDGIFSTTNKNQNATIYAEYITKSGLDSSGAAITANPSDFSLNALVKLRQDSPDKDKFTFYLDTEDFTAPHDNPAKLLLAQGNNEGLNGNQNGILYVRSEANNRTVTINETVSGNFANDADTFTPVVYLTPTDDSEVNASETFDGVAWIRDGNNNRLRLVTPLGELRGNGTDSHNVSVPAGWKLIVEQTDDNNYVPSTPSVIKTGTTDSVAYENGVVVSDDLTITIDNVRNTIPTEGMADENGSDKTIVFVLTGVAVLSAGAGVAYVYRKKDEFNEQ